MRRITLVTLIITICLNYAPAEQFTPLQLLQKYKINRAGLQTHITKSEQLSELRDTAYGDKPKWSRTIYEFRTDGKRVDIIINRSFRLSSPDSESLPKNTSHQRMIWDGHNWFSCTYGDFPGEPPAIGFISKKEEKKNSFIPLGYGGSSLDGTFFGDQQSVETILSQASDISLRPQMEAVNEVDCYVIKASTPYGKYDLWIDPQHGYNIARARVYKSGNDILNGKPISKYSKSKAEMRDLQRQYKGKLPGGIEKFFFSLDIVEFQKIANVWVPTEGNYQHTIKYVDGRVKTEKRLHKRTHIDPTPDFEAISAFVPDIPDGARITLDDVPSISFEWREGKLVPNIDEDVEAQLDEMAEKLMAEGFDTAKMSKTNTKKKDRSTLMKSNSESKTTLDIVPASRQPHKDSRIPIEEESPVWIVILVVLICLVLAGISWLIFHTRRKRI